MASFPITNRQKAVKIDRAEVRRLCASVAQAEGRPNWRIGLTFVDNAEILDLNRRFLHHDYVTDVISFPLDEDDPRDDDLSGEVVVSAELAVQMAARRGGSPRRELYLYVVHGLLHLLGYDDTSPDKRRRMVRRQNQLLRAFLGDK